MQQIMMAVAVQFRVPTVPEGAPAADVLGRCFAKLPRDRPTADQLAEAFALAAVPTHSPVLEEQTLKLAQRMVEQEAITGEVTRVNSRLTQEISQLKQENVRLGQENARLVLQDVLIFVFHHTLLDRKGDISRVSRGRSRSAIR